MKSFSVEDLSPQQLQTYLQSSVAPRPIAVASTIDAKGNPNVSPFSFFNVFSSQPPILVFSPARRVRDNTTKHTLQNVLEVPEVVIGITNFPMVQQVSLSSTEYSREENEFVKAGLTQGQSQMVGPSLILESPVNFECKVNDVIALGKEGGAGNLVICEVLMIHIHDEFLDHNENLDTEKLDLVCRLGGNWYGRMIPESLFTIPKPLKTKGIGFDNLPTEVKDSKVLTGNDLAMLANTEKVPLGQYSKDEKIHQKAKELLVQNRVEEAWQVLQVQV